MGKKIIAAALSLLLCVGCLYYGAWVADAATVLYNNAEGNDGAYTYVLWKDYGDTSMTLNGNGKFECW